MTTRQVIVPWKKGLHLRVATRLVRLAQTFRSTIRVRCGDQVANLGSIISVISLCAVMGSALVVEVSGDDEQEAVRAVEQVFSLDDEAGST
ncbi:MAG TPA: HPr family phosphocarrier protein [Verrucomicrobiae bacterium]